MTLGIKAFAQETHGYGLEIAIDLSDYGFVVTSTGSPHLITMNTLDVYDEELTRQVITTELGKYSDIIRIKPWSRYKGMTISYYRKDDTILIIEIFENLKDSYGKSRGCTVFISEFIDGS